MKHLRYVAFLLAACAALPASGAGCGKAPEPATLEALSPETTVTEKNGDLELTWDIGPGGRVIGQARKNGIPIPTGVTAALTVRPQSGGDGTRVPLTAAPDGTLTGKIPPLTDDLTEIAYEVQAGDTSASGAMHLPRGGTRELVESAKEAASAKVVPRGVKGPNGGVVQVVGDDVVEVVADRDSRAVRMYFLDDDLKVVPAGKKKGKLALVGASSVIVDLSLDPGGVYLAGKVPVQIEPIKVTVVVIDGVEVDVALCGYAPGGVIVVGPAAPVIAVFIVTGWPVVVVPAPVIVQPGVVVVQKGKGKGKWKWKGKW